MRKIGFDNYRFESEAPENYLDNTPQGRADLKVFSIDDFSNRQRYFIIECATVDSVTIESQNIGWGISSWASSDS